MSIFEVAKEEFLNSNEEEQNRLVYAYFGLAVYHSQCVEESLSFMVCCNRIQRNNVQTNEDVNEIIDVIENSKRTLGNFINEVKQAFELPNQVEEELLNVLNLRNFIVHKYFKVQIVKMITEQGRLEIIGEFCDFIDKSLKVDGCLKQYYSHFQKKFGITDEIIKQKMEVMKTNELKRVDK